MLAVSLPCATEAGGTPSPNSTIVLAEATLRRCRPGHGPELAQFLSLDLVKACKQRVQCNLGFLQKRVWPAWLSSRMRSSMVCLRFLGQGSGGSEGSDSSHGSGSDSHSSSGTTSSGSGTCLATARVMVAIRRSTCLQSLSVFLMCPTWPSKG